MLRASAACFGIQQRQIQAPNLESFALFDAVVAENPENVIFLVASGSYAGILSLPVRCSAAKPFSCMLNV
jgi:hypothetical protein